MTKLDGQGRQRAKMEQAKILIVDDDPDITEATKVLLENNGYEVDCARDGNEAMLQIQRSRPSLIILDVMMTTLEEGFSLARDLKKNPAYDDIPILIMTSIMKRVGIDFKTAAGDRDWLPVEDYLDKPVKPEVLLKKVKSLLEKS